MSQELNGRVRWIHVLAHFSHIITFTLVVVSVLFALELIFILLEVKNSHF